jgi:hypothetical protein
MATNYGVSFDTKAGALETASTTIPQIREGNFSSEYLKKMDGYNLRVSIGHTEEKTTKYERHLFKVSKITPQMGGKATAEEAYVIIRGPKTMGETTAKALVLELQTFLTPDHVSRLFGWQS